MRRLAVVVLALITLAASCDDEPGESGSTTSTVVTTTATPTSPVFDWSVEPRFGLDGDGDGLIDVPNTVEYVLGVPAGACPCPDVVAEFAVTLTAEPTGDEHEWVVSGAALAEPLVVVSEQPEGVVSLPEGTYDVRLTVTTGTTIGTAEATMTVADILFVSAGDSYAGGEGNPERRAVDPGTDGVVATWADGGAQGAAAEILHAGAHRSTLSGHAQAALDLEEADPRTSVTFVFLAATGATIDQGLLGPKPGTVEQPPQLEQLAGLLGCDGESCARNVDVLTLSVGGNDAGFAFAIGSLIALDPLLSGQRYDDLLESLLGVGADRVAALPDAFARLAAALDALQVDRVLITGYPWAGGTVVDEDVVTCDEIADDLIFGLEVDAVELDAAVEAVAGPLNEAVATAADTHGWTYVDAHVEEFRGHGYCGSEPYPPETYEGNPWPEAVPDPPDAATRWFRTADESAVVQADDDGGGRFAPERLGTNGTLHPNEFGHQAIAAALLAAYRNG